MAAAAGVLDARGVADYVLALCHAEEGRLVRVAIEGRSGGASGGAGSATATGGIDLVVKDVSDGNATANVWAVVNQAGAAGGAVIVKQALLTMRGAPGVALDAGRAGVEEALLRAHGAAAPEFFPRLLHYDAAARLLVLERLEGYVTLRGDLVMGNTVPELGEDVGTYLGAAAFATSAGVAPPPPAATAALAACDNNRAATVLTAALTFDAPLGDSVADTPAAAFPNRVPASAAVAAVLAHLRADAAVRDAAAAARRTYVDSRQALIHGALTPAALVIAHGAIVLASPEEAAAAAAAAAAHRDAAAMSPFSRVKVGDGGGEARWGPLGYDIGVLLAHLAASWLAWRVRIRAADVLIARGGYAKFSAEKTRERWATAAGWLAHEAAALWQHFVLASAAAATAATPTAPLGTFLDTMTAVYADAASFAGAELLRHVGGATSFLDIDKADASPAARAGAEVRALLAARALLTGAAPAATALRAAVAAAAAAGGADGEAVPLATCFAAGAAMPPALAPLLTAGGSLVATVVAADAYPGVAPDGALSDPAAAFAAVTLSAATTA